MTFHMPRMLGPARPSEYAGRDLLEPMISLEAAVCEDRAEPVWPGEWPLANRDLANRDLANRDLANRKLASRDLA